jgi:uncharacterized membrane protein YcaP (DUF421 family)
MFELTRPWWEIIARAAIIYGGLFLVLRLFGKRQLGEFTPFDFIFLLLLSDSVSRALVGGDRSLIAAFLALVTLMALNLAMTYVTTRFHLAERLLEGRPQFLVREGKVDYAALRREGISKNDLLAALRKNGCESPNEADWVVLETTGTMTVKKRGG